MTNATGESTGTTGAETPGGEQPVPALRAQVSKAMMTERRSISVRARARLKTGLRRALAARGVVLPVLINTNLSWGDYLNKLSKPARKNQKAALKGNADLTFSAAPYSEAETGRFMAVWETTSGKRFPANYLAGLTDLARRGLLQCFAARRGDEVLALHLVESYGNYGKCDAPWFDYDFGRRRSLATFMWFSLLEHATSGNSQFEWLDLMGGPVSRLAPDHYKRRYVPEEDGRVVFHCTQCRFKFLSGEDPRVRTSCPGCRAEARLTLLDRLLIRFSSMV